MINYFYDKKNTKIKISNYNKFYNINPKFIIVIPFSMTFLKIFSTNCCDLLPRVVHVIIKIY